MTSVNITTTKNTVTVNEGTSTVVTVATQGPSGPSFSSSGKSMNDSNAVNGSLVRLDVSSGTFIADSTVTVSNIVDGGNF